MQTIETYKNLFLNFLNEKVQIKEPENLYIPINYILQIGGKRLRPVLTLMLCDLFDGDSKEALNAALAVEVFHNFTLIHDDIMDSAPIRRGKQTVHKKWNVNAGILSGDAMMIMAYQFLELYEPFMLKELLPVFNKTALEVCEGQQMDIDFETRNNVTIAEYLKMITFKTSVLVAATMQIGAIIAKTSEENKKAVYQFGLNLGLAFQLQDDYLDTFGDAAVFGKKIGGDIAENKKTYLFLKCLEVCDDADKQKLLKLYTEKSEENETKIDEVTTIFKKNNIHNTTLNEIESYTNKAFEVLDKISLAPSKKAVLKEFGLNLMKRTI